MEKNFSFDIKLGLTKEDIKLIETLKNSNYRGFGDDIYMDTDTVLGLTRKGVLYHSMNELGQGAYFLTPLGESILDRLIELGRVFEFRNYTAKKLAKILEELQNEPDIFNLNISNPHNNYWSIGQLISRFRDANQTLGNDRLLRFMNPSEIGIEDEPVGETPMPMPCDPMPDDDMEMEVGMEPTIRVVAEGTQPPRFERGFDEGGILPMCEQVYPTNLVNDEEFGQILRHMEKRNNQERLDEIPELNIRLETVQVEGGVRNLVVRREVEDVEFHDPEAD